MAKKWIQAANVKKGALTAEAKAHGKSLSAYMAHPGPNASAKTHKRIVFAQIMRHMAKQHKGK